MNTRFMRGVPTLPKVLYSPLRPVPKMVFMNMWGTVSSSAFLMSPKRSSTVHTFMPFGISLSVPSESALCFVDLRVTFPSSSIWLNESNCAHAINGMSTKSVRDIKCLYIKLGLFTQQSQATFCHLEDDGAEQNECAYGMA